eukprot:352270-Chlamydomonas_euryale.AAC.1
MWNKQSLRDQGPYLEFVAEEPVHAGPPLPRFQPRHARDAVVHCEEAQDELLVLQLQLCAGRDGVQRAEHLAVLGCRKVDEQLDVVLCKEFGKGRASVTLVNSGPAVERPDGKAEAHWEQSRT